MIKNKILQKDAPVLRKVAKSVLIKDIGSKKISAILNKMKKALSAEEDGAAIAAPQIGENLRIFIISDKLPIRLKSHVFINPEIIKASKKSRRMEEGCLSIRWLYGQVKRSEKVVIRAYDKAGKQFERGASGLLAQIFQHETDHLDGILFIDKAENIRDLPPAKNIRFVFFGSSQFSNYVLNELKFAGLSPILNISSTKNLPSVTELKRIDAEVFIVASFGKILPKELIELPKHGSLNVHPSLLPELRGPSPIQSLILGRGKPGVTIIKMDERADHGPILAQARVSMVPWPDHYQKVEEKLARAGGKLMVSVLSNLANTECWPSFVPQDDSRATYTKLIKKENGLLDLSEPAEKNLKKVLAYSAWPSTYMFYKNKKGVEIRVVIKDAVIKEDKFIPTRVIPAGKREMDWEDFLRGN
ncbi:MAG: peptide deformylase [Candidatus Zambryskibacteria bacterium]|nr:peptide deformylase [Candidatus Zambryskibacteria bacterium]